MNVTDSRRATSAAWLVISALGANLGLTVLAYGVSWLLPGSYEGAWPLIQDLLWLGTALLLAVGLGVTVVSMEAASNGGRYVVATGAIGVGVGRLIRGLIRLGRAS